MVHSPWLRRVWHTGDHPQVALINGPIANTFVEHHATGTVQQRKNVNSNDFEGVVGELGSNIIRIASFHEAVRPVPLRVIAGHDLQPGLLILHLILQVVNVLANIIIFEAGKTIQ